MKCDNEKIFYIDPVNGDDANDGLSSLQPIKSYVNREICGGDTVLFKRGSVIRDILYTRNGTENCPVTYGAYGDGEKPVFMGSTSVGDAGLWTEEIKFIWRFTGEIKSEVCNIIFNNGEFCGNMRWELNELGQPGEWHYTGIGKSSADEKLDNETLYIYSPINPGLAYTSIECALWGHRLMVSGQHDIIIENISFQNSGVHGYQGFHTRNIIIRNCDFRFIGGAVWSRELKIRFGNAIEYWDGACNNLVEGCYFDNIYDSGVTHQGGETRNIPEQLYFRNNFFSNFGMSAYECREPSQQIYFEYNTCVNAGKGFSMQAETPPRQSEIYPQPMGHHVFIWRVEPGTQPGNVYIRHNIFSEAPYGAAIYSIIDPVDERLFVINDNCYWQTTGELMMRFGGKSYLTTEFSKYQKECGQDANSVVTKPAFMNETDGDYQLNNETDYGWKG